ncbi:hypothetical protein ABEB36_007680 [Hypothenemus hampei]|uniref:Codanin-1 C-terminal domain-containing protein n=1 Tax=Hypothenemus hampei TaxID=57062 RepID=A0ABD1EV14_HYPHA
MASLLLNKVINEEIPSTLLINWVLGSESSKNKDFQEITEFNVSQIDFITHFLNFIHETVPSNTVSSEDTNNKLNTPKKIDEKIDQRPRTDKPLKTSLFTTPRTELKSLNIKTEKTGNFCTPKAPENTVKKHGDSYFSPISPLYGQIESNTTVRSVDTKSSDKYTLCLGDFIVNSTRNSKKKKVNHETSRRIKPTSLCKTSDYNNDFRRTENSFNFENVAEIAKSTANEQRNFLVKEREKVILKKDVIQGACFLKKRSSLSKGDDIKPTTSCVTFKNSINSVVNIYRTILDHHLVLNITSEIYFLISLILTQQTDQNGNKQTVDCDLGVEALELQDIPMENCQISENLIMENAELFKTIHNVVYFAVKSLESQEKIIRLYDKTTLRLLAENDRIKEFSLVFANKLAKFANTKLEKPCYELVSSSLHQNVCFNPDTDIKGNFPDQTSFLAFKQQRDLFYDILRIWETQHLTAGWNFSLKLGGKIRSLFTFNCCSTNLIYLSRLFKNQLLNSCAKGPNEKGLSDNTALPSFAIDADKLSRLTDRLVTKHTTNGINSLPIFSGYQEFFKEFIEVSANYIFCRHLCDCLISSIIELNNTQISGDDLHERENTVDLNARKLYTNCVRNLRLLAKFLGFIESLPYKTNNNDKLIDIQMEMRQEIHPVLDIKSLLLSAIQNQNMILIIPWLTKYLAMLDYTTLRLPYYTTVIWMLFDIYHNYAYSEVEYNVALVQLSLGWLFELPHFPESEFFNFCSSRLGIKDRINGVKSSNVKHYMDSMAIVDQNILYLYCPFLQEIKKLLSDTSCGNKMTAKYITPLTAVETNSETIRKKLKEELEEAFLGGQPSSVRKTIEFISERLASITVKHICNDLMPKANIEVLSEFRKVVLLPFAETDLYKKKIYLQEQAARFAETNMNKFLEKCEETLENIVNGKVSCLIKNLMPLDSLEETENVCIEITKKKCKERVTEWMRGHITSFAFTKELEREILKEIMKGKKPKIKSPFELPPNGKDCTHNEDTLSSVHVLDNLRESSCKILENVDVSADYVEQLLQQTYRTLTERNDINECMVFHICTTAFDYYLLLVTKYPTMFTEPLDLESMFLKIWAVHPQADLTFKNLFCSRNVKILGCQEEAWNLYAKLISLLLKKKIIEFDNLESQCTGFYNKNWDSTVLKNYSTFLKRLVRYCSSDISEHKFQFLLDFLSDFCLDL